MNLGTASCRPVIDCFCDTDLVHAAYAVCGLIELADAGELELRFRLRDFDLRKDRRVWTLWLRVAPGDGGESYGVCLDFHDGADYFCPASLEACRRYYKSNLNPRTVAAVAPHLREKLLPFGPYFPCRPANDRSLQTRRLGSLYGKYRQRFRQAAKPASFTSRLRQFAPEILRYRRYLSRKLATEYESPPIDAAPTSPPPLVFNPTCWDECEGEPIERMNTFRASLIRALRATFGNRFIGGFRRSETAVQKYADALETRVLSHDEYLQLFMASPIAIYGNGKFDCFSWRLGEAFAASKCIVSERIPNDAGATLDESVGCLQADDVPAIIDNIRRLDADPDLLPEYCRRSHQFYVDRLRPSVRMRSILKETLRHAQSPPDGVATGATA